MAPKRQREDDDATMYFVDAVARMPDAPRAQKHVRDALQEAHRWGHAMLQAQLDALRNQGVGAAARFSRLQNHAKLWYLGGYQAYLEPEAPGLPRLLRDRRGGTLPHWLGNQSSSQLRGLAFQETEKWLPRLTSAPAHAAAVRERDEEARTHLTPPKAAPSASPGAPVRAVAPPPLPRGATRTPDTQPSLPAALSALLTNPKGNSASAAPPKESKPSPCMRAQVAELIRSQRILRVWEGGKLATLPMRACALQRRLEKRELGALFGGGGSNGGKSAAADARMASLGLEKVGTGTFNAVWLAGERAQREHGPIGAFPPEVRADMAAKRVVLRAPKDCSRWFTFDELVGEVHNIVFTACRGLGPRVAALAYARKLSSCKSRTQEGVVVVLYHLFVLLERATSNADARFVAATLPNLSALHKPYYFSAMLVAIHKMSTEGYVHLDATLRNFVDFYPTSLGRTASEFAVRIIDVDPSCFRRLRPTPSADWRALFLFNLLFVLVGLKVRLAGRWDPEQYWKPVAPCVEALRAQLPPRGEPGGGLAGALRWTGAFRMEDPFPDIVRGPLAGDTDEAATGAASEQLRFYLIKQPVNEALARYVNFAAPDAEQARKASAWYDTVYREQMLPSMRFFLAQLTAAPPSAGVRFVDVAHEFLVTPHAALQHRYLRGVPHSKDHDSNTPQKRVLGLA